MVCMMETDYLLGELKNFLDRQGRLVKYPSKMRPKILSLFYLASKFRQDIFYTEKEVNTLLNEWHVFGDPCMLRRDLYDRSFFNREKNGSKYWLEKKQPVLEDFAFLWFE